MNIKCNGKYVNKLGEIVVINSIDIKSNGMDVLIDTIGRSYYENGEYYYGSSKYDLVKEIE